MWVTCLPRRGIIYLIIRIDFMTKVLITSLLGLLETTEGQSIPRGVYTCFLSVLSKWVGGWGGWGGWGG